MIVSTNGDGHHSEFEKLLDGTLTILSSDAKNFKGRSSFQFEQDVKGIMDEEAIETPFEGTLILKSGAVFPDIVTDPERFPFGVEVKTTVRNHWTTVGNSVLESTRVPGIDHIYLLFGKLSTPVGFRCRRYEECLSGVAVTHSPRYLIDMALSEGETFFDKMPMDYDDLRSRDDPISPIKSYYRTILKPGESLWWLETVEEEPPSSNVVIRMWSGLSPNEREELTVKAMTLFPRIFRNGDQLKYSDLAAWLVNKHSVLNTSLRDPFTAGGKEDIIVGGKTYEKVNKIIENLRIRVPAIVQFLRDPNNLGEIRECWGEDVQLRKTVEIWISKVEKNSQSLFREKAFPLREMIKENMSQLF